MTSIVRTATRNRAIRLPRSDEVHIWQIPIAGSVQVLDRLWRLLDSTEQDHAASFRFDRDRNRYVVAHGALRQVLGSYLRLDPRSLSFRTTRDRKPVLRGLRAKPALGFNLSHDDDLALVGVTRSGPVGVDVQSHEAPINVAVVAREIVTLRERAYLARSEADLRCEVLRLWARKEAVVKARGTGMADRLDRFDVSGDSPVTITASGRRLVVQDLDVGRGYSAAVATTTARQRVIRFTWGRGS